MMPFYSLHKKLIFLPAVFFLFRVNGQLNCENDTTGLKSLIDLQTGYYLGFQGGLYPYGLNTMPLGHFSGGMNAARKVLPRNDAGIVDWMDGKVGFIGLGASTAGNCFNHFEEVVEDYAEINPCLTVANCSLGAKGLDIMIDTAFNGWYWDEEIMPRVANADLTPQQVQVIWIMTTSKVDTIFYWPYQPRQIADKYEVLMGILLDKFPNLQMVFLTGFAYGGYADPAKEFYDLVAEPSSYWNNWSVKWLVERQINADPDLVYSGPGKKSPWLGWGPHFWADGLRANFVDGLYWNCYTDFQPDGGGYHLSSAGKDKEADMMLDFFKNSLVAHSWFDYSARWHTCDPEFREQMEAEQVFDIAVFPNPTSGNFNVEVMFPPQQEVSISVFNATGSLVHASTVSAADEYSVVTLDLSDQPTGLYRVILQGSDKTVQKTVTVVH